MFEQSRTYYLYNKPTDMRKSFNTLGVIVKHSMNLDLLSGAGFIFINKRRTHLKMLLWEGDGFSLYYKRLAKGTFEHPNIALGKAITYQQLLLILQGISLQKIVKRKRFLLAKTS